MSNDKINSAKEEINETSKLMKNNIESLVEQGEYLENIQNRTSELERQSTTFKHQTTDLKQKLCISNLKIIIYGSIAVGIFVTIIVMAIVLSIKK